ncbi:Pyridoxine/pyridoxamine 5'-phosphate oxidase [uncultured archaeon]|nr:Pyridoxine/pyridoxamine 5'-phosphate oxidase [uncultured archaeon]
MDFKDCINFANENRVSYVATCDGGQPRVRAFLMWLADESGFYFHTGSTKGVFRQLKANQKVEVCVCTTKFDRMMRVAGEVEFLDDPALRLRLLEERPFLKAIVKGPDDPLLTIFRIPHGVAYFWTMADNMREAEVPRIKF